MAKRDFYVVIEKDQDGFFVGEVPQLRGCYSQRRSLDELLDNMKEVIELCLEEVDIESMAEFVGIHKIEI